MLRYRSDLLRYFDRVAFYLLYVLGIFDESQTVQLSLVQSYVDNGVRALFCFSLRNLSRLTLESG
jgi:hypothetical protein